ncbi:hypothetical protein P0Y43_23375 [Pseudomonas entomophila]|uniref:hypothetical protein n=1 Tax=Pseudomonas entomophila TaxID=312306 RepID=UPI0023D8C5AA|nr:hypothetical protein [Pseudomonas entomophila]MDF0733632.1 hypothetical protein [Pseudomonas entomophila]
MMTERSFRTYTIACYAITGAIIAALFLENFTFSSNFGILGFREIDDVAFQSTLRRVHLGLQSGNLGQLFSINDYAYGWIFWAPLVLVTYPLFMISQALSVDWPLIVAPRQISLLFAVLSMIVMRKTLKRLEVPEWGCASAVLIFALFPSLGYFSLRFGTVNTVAFFSLLTVYLALNDERATVSGTVRVALSLAVAGSLKLSGLLIAPLAAFLMLRRIKGRQIVPALLIPAAVFLLTLGILTNPQFLLIPFKPQIWTEYLATVKHFLEMTRVPSGPENPIERFYLGAFSSLANTVVMAVLATGWLVAIIRNRACRADFVAILVAVTMATTYLILSVKSTTGIGSYFTSVSFLILLGITGYASSPKAVYLFSTLVVLMLADFAHRAELEFEKVSSVTQGFKSSPAPKSHFSYFIKETFSSNDMSLASSTVSCIEKHSNGRKPGHIFIDFTAPSAINALSYPETCVSVAWNNLSPAGKYCDKPVDFLVLDTRDAVGFLPIYEFEKWVKKTDEKTAEGYKLDRQTRQLLSSEGTFDNQRFTVACDLGRLKVFKSEVLLSNNKPVISP